MKSPSSKFHTFWIIAFISYKKTANSGYAMHQRDINWNLIAFDLSFSFRDGVHIYLKATCHWMRISTILIHFQFKTAAAACGLMGIIGNIWKRAPKVIVRARQKHVRYKCLVPGGYASDQIPGINLLGQIRSKPLWKIFFLTRALAGKWYWKSTRFIIQLLIHLSFINFPIFIP